MSRLMTVFAVVFAAAESCSDGGRRCSARACGDSAHHGGYGADDRERRDANRSTGDHRQSSHSAGDCRHTANHHRDASTCRVKIKQTKKQPNVDNFNVLDEKSCLYYTLPPPCIDEHRIFRHQNKFQPARARTTRYNKSFLFMLLIIILPKVTVDRNEVISTVLYILCVF